MTQTLTAPKNGIRFAGRTYREGEQLPEKYYKVQQSSRPRDPGSGQKDVPPNAGRAVLPHVFTFSGRISSLAKVYQYSDEALRHSIENAHMMLNDPVISGPLFARQQMVALLNWHVEPEDEKDEQQKEIAAKLTDILKQIPRFTEYRRVLTEAVWYGRQGLQNRYGFWHTSKGERYRAITGWEPVSGDKLVFRFDDGTGQFDPNQIGVKVTPALGGHDAIAGDRTYEPTPQGMAYFLEQWERALFVVHKHFIRDGEYEDPLSSGSIHGVGLRSFLYWVWYQKQETLAQLVELVERTGNGIIVLYYPSGNDEARKETEQIGKTMEHSNVLVMPYDHGDPDSNRIDNIAPNTAGLDALHSLIDDYYGDMITRFILGQTLSTKATATGLGSGVADLHKDSLMDIVRYDAVNLEETITKEVLHPLRNFNFPKFRQVNFRFVINTEANVPAEKLQAILQAWQMGAKLKASDLFEIIGLSMPSADDETLFNPQIVGAIEQMAQQRAQQAAGMVPGMPPGGDPMQGAGGDPNQPPTDGGPDGNDGGPGDSGPSDPTGGPAPAQMSEPAADDPVAKLFGPILNSRRGSLRPVRYSRRDELSAIVAEAASQTDTNPSAEQVAAGNYRKGRFWWNGLEIVIETPRGASRKGKGWERELGDHYGYIRRTESERDGDHIDCYIGPEPDSEVVYVVDQVTAGGRFDEHKCMIGYTSQRDAVVAYRANYPSDWKLGPVTAMTARQFKAWLLAGDTNKPIYKQVSRYAKLWEEGKHPRAEDGEFSSSQGSPTKKPFAPSKTNPWNHRKGGLRDAIFNVGKHVDDKGVTHAKGYAAYLQKKSDEYGDVDKKTPLGKFVIGIKDAIDEIPHEFSFINVETGYGEENNAFGITGTGRAKEVIENATQILGDALHHYQPHVVYFTAKEGSRASLYKFLSSRVSRKHPEYTAVQLRTPTDAPSVFALVRKESLGKVLDVARKAKMPAEELTADKYHTDWYELLAAFGLSKIRYSKAWDEEKHPRADSGEFAPKGSGSVRPGLDDSITAKKKQGAFWLGMNDDPDHGLLFGEKEEGKAKKEEAAEKEATPKKKPRMHFKGDEAEYTGEMRDGFYVVKMLEGRFEGEEKLVTRPPEGFSGPDEKKLAEWKEQQEAFGRLHDLSKSESTGDESEPAEPELNDLIETDSSITLDEPKATEPEDVALHAYRTGQPKAQAIREAMTEHGMNPDDWRETLRVAKAYDVHRMNGGATTPEAKDEPAKEESKAVAPAMEQEPEPAPEPAAEAEAEAEAEDAIEPISEPIADDTDELADSPADNDNEFELKPAPVDATPREAADYKGQQMDPDYDFARASAIPNAGKDLKGSARHKRNEWKTLQEAEEGGGGDTFATKANLQKTFPHELMEHVDQKPLVALTMHYALNKFPAKSNYRDIKRMTPEEQAKSRREYVEEYKAFQAKAHELAEKHATSKEALEGLKQHVVGRIDALRKQKIVNEAGVEVTDRFNDMANNMVSLSNALNTAWRAKKTDVRSQVNNFMEQVHASYPDTKPEERHSLYSQHAADVMEGESLNSSLGKKGEKDRTFDPARAYVTGKAERTGGRKLSAETANKAVSFLVSDIGLAGVQWGNSVTDSERQHHGPKAAEALMDLADATGLSDADISLGGKLGLAIGARGKGGALAHYEPGTQVINLTRASGVGSLAHEWGHAFDHSLSHFQGKLFSDDHAYAPKGKATPMHEAYAKLDAATTAYRTRIHEVTNEHVRAGKMSDKKGQYWRSREEVFARCFERYVQHKLHSQGRENTYLVGLRKKNEDDVTNLWPTLKEAEEMAPAFDAIFKLYKEQGAPPPIRYAKRDVTKHRYAVRHAPKGGVQIRGKQYTGGQFIPSEEYDQADPATKSAIDQASGTATGAIPNASGQLTSRFDAADEGTKVKAPSGTWTKTGDQWQHESGRTQGSAGLSQEFASGRSGGGVSGAHQQLNQIGQEEGQPRHRETLNESRVNGVVSHNSPDMTPDEHKSVGDWHAQQAEAFKQKAEGLPDNPKLRAEAQKQAQGHAGAAQWHQDEGARKHQEANPTIVPEHIAALDAAPVGSKVGEFTKDDSGAWKHPVGTKLDSHALAKSYGRKGKSEQLGQEIAKLPQPSKAVQDDPLEAVKSLPPPAPGMVRFYHGGDEQDGPKWFSQSPEYAHGYATHDGRQANLYYMDFPKDHPLLQKSFDDTGTGQTAPFVNFEAPADISQKAKLVNSPDNSPANQSTATDKNDAGGTAGPKQPKAHPLATLTKQDRNNLKSVAGMYGINPGDKANLNRAANFSLLAARKIGLNPKGASKAEQVAHAVKFLASQQPRLESLVQTAQQLGYKGKAQHLVARSRGASEHIVKEAAKNGYQASGKFDKADLIGALQHLAAVKKPVSEAGPPQSPASGYGPSGDSQGRGPLSRTLGLPVDHGDSGARPSFHQVIAKLADSVGGQRNLWIAAGTVAALWFAFTHQQRRQFFDKAGQGGFNVIRYEE